MIALYTVLVPLSLALVGYVLMWVGGFGRGNRQSALSFTAVIANVVLGVTLLIGVLVSDDVKPDGLALWMLVGWTLGVAACAIVASLRPAKKNQDRPSET